MSELTLDQRQPDPLMQQLDGVRMPQLTSISKPTCS